MTTPNLSPMDSKCCLVRIHPEDDVAVALEPLVSGQELDCEGIGLRLECDVPAGHKIALRQIASGASVRKYGHPIGRANGDIRPGDWVHSHNLVTELGEDLNYTRQERVTPQADRSSDPVPTFQGYRRADGRVATRNEIWILNTVGCVNRSAERIARKAHERFAGRVDGVHAFSHPFGCSQLGDDLAHTRRILAALLRHPNAGGVLVLGLGCENNQLDALIQAAETQGHGAIDPARLRAFNAQEVEDEIEFGLEAVAELVEVVERDERTTCPASELVLGLKCGGSDGLSGLTANPLVGRIADRLTAWGGTAVLTEVPEMFGAEHVLMERAASRQVFDQVSSMVGGFKDYFRRHDQPIYENPSPGNKDGGLTTLEEKSLGAIQKGGQATVTQVLRYGEAASQGGLVLLESPGNDGVSSTALTAAGSTVLLFTTGRGTPLGFPAPTVKIASNSDLAKRKSRWIDFDAGQLVSAGKSLDQLADELKASILEIASGRETRNERNEDREIAIWKEGVTL